MSEGELRKLENTLNEQTSRQHQIRTQLEDKQGTAQQIDKQTETCKRMIEQKQNMLAQFQ